MKINKILKIAVFSVIPILFIILIRGISQNEYEEEIDEKKILEIEQVLKNRTEENNSIASPKDEKNEITGELIIINTKINTKNENKTQQTGNTTTINENSSINNRKINTEKSNTKKSSSNNFYVETMQNNYTETYVDTGNYVAENTDELFWPVLSTKITSHFGKRTHPISKTEKNHNGIDVEAVKGSAVMSSVDGVVVYAGKRGNYGNLIEVKRNDGLIVRYAHLNQINTGVGKNVRMGDKIGEVGSTGLSTGPHLHFEVIENGNSVDPMKFKYR